MPHQFSLWLRAFAALSLAVVVGGCGPPPPRVPTAIFEPTFMDFIKSVTPIGNHTLEFQLASGGSYAYDRQTALDDIEPTPDDMLLAGTREGTGWAYVVSSDGRNGSCYRVRAPAFLREGRVMFASGLSLPTSPGFNASSAGPDGVWAYDQDWFCVNAEGFVSGYEAFGFQ
jgi:hypothetical protein